MTAEPHPQRCETCNKIECVFNLTKWYSTWHSDLYYFIDKMGCASHSSAKSERGNCPQNKIWDHCPVSERIQQGEQP